MTPFAQQITDEVKLKYGYAECVGQLAPNVGDPSLPGYYAASRFSTLFYYDPKVKDWLSVDSYCIGVGKYDGGASPGARLSLAWPSGGVPADVGMFPVPGAGYVHMATLYHVNQVGLGQPSNAAVRFTFSDVDPVTGLVARTVMRTFPIPDAATAGRHQTAMVFDPPVRVYHYDHVAADIVTLNGGLPMDPPSYPACHVFFRFRMNPLDNEEEMGMNP